MLPFKALLGIKASESPVGELQDDFDDHREAVQQETLDRLQEYAEAGDIEALLDEPILYPDPMISWYKAELAAELLRQAYVPEESVSVQEDYQKVLVDDGAASSLQEIGEWIDGRDLGVLRGTPNGYWIDSMDDLSDVWDIDEQGMVNLPSGLRLGVVSTRPKIGREKIESGIIMAVDRSSKAVLNPLALDGEVYWHLMVGIGVRAVGADDGEVELPLNQRVLITGVNEGGGITIIDGILLSN